MITMKYCTFIRILYYSLDDWEAVYAGNRSHKKYLGISKVHIVKLYVYIRIF